MESLFGTDGIRKKIGLSPFTTNALSQLVQAICIWAQEKYKKKANFIICHDTRYSSYWIKSTFKAYLNANSFDVYDANILPTPAIFHLMKNNLKFDAAIIISASHNSYKDNGIKIVDKNFKISPKDEEIIKNLIKKKLN